MSSDTELTGKVALVTGGSRGIGRAICLALAKEGVDVAVNYKSREHKADQVCNANQLLGRRSTTVVGDVASASDIQRMVESVESALGKINILINNAGVAHPQPIEDLSEAEWDETIEVNLKSAFLTTQAVLPEMRAEKWGRIINISSTAYQTGGIIGPHYTASKAGMIGLTRSYASILAKEGITVNAIAPALIDTDMIAGNTDADPEMIPVKRFGTAGEVADVVVMLAKNGYITGETVNINGGIYMGG